METLEEIGKKDGESQLKVLIAKGKEQGYLTYHEVNDHLPDDIVDPEQIEDIINMINDMGIKVHETAPDLDGVLLNDNDVDDEAAEEAALSGIRVYTVGIGDPIQGARIPTTRYGQPAYIVHDGNEVWSIMNPEELKNVATAGNGAFVPAGTANLDLASIYAQRIATDAGKSFDSVKLEQFIPRFQWFAIPALLILLGDSWLSLRVKYQSVRRTFEVST